jgi:glutamate dehydrogenase/leucine dehydrogenase
MLAAKGQSLAGKTCIVSGAGNVAQYTVQKLIQEGAKVVTLSDSSGHIYDEEGITEEKLQFIFELKNVFRGRISEYARQYPNASFTPANPSLGYNRIWDHKADCAFPSATQDSQRMAWSREEVDKHLNRIMKSIHTSCLTAAEAYGSPCNYVVGANIHAFTKVADAMCDQGIV